jgi:hypothetical protein
VKHSFHHQLFNSGGSAALKCSVTTRKGVGPNPAWFAFYLFGKSNAKIRFLNKFPECGFWATSIKIIKRNPQKGGLN